MLVTCEQQKQACPSEQQNLGSHQKQALSRGGHPSQAMPLKTTPSLRICAYVAVHNLRHTTYGTFVAIVIESMQHGIGEMKRVTDLEDRIYPYSVETLSASHLFIVLFK